MYTSVVYMTVAMVMAVTGVSSVKAQDENVLTASKVVMVPRGDVGLTAQSPEVVHVAAPTAGPVVSVVKVRPMAFRADSASVVREVAVVATPPSYVVVVEGSAECRGQRTRGGPHPRRPLDVSLIEQSAALESDRKSSTGDFRFLFSRNRCSPLLTDSGGAGNAVF
jgi:hypothetical protein